MTTITMTNFKIIPQMDKEYHNVQGDREDATMVLNHRQETNERLLYPRLHLCPYIQLG